MYKLMHSKVFWLSKTLATLVAWIRFLSCGRPYMLFEITWITKTLSAIVTSITPLSCIGRIKPLSQWLHLKGPSPVCVLLCILRSHLRLKLLLQRSHVKDLPSIPVLVRILSRIWRSLKRLNLFPQWLQSKLPKQSLCSSLTSSSLSLDVTSLAHFH